MATSCVSQLSGSFAAVISLTSSQRECTRPTTSLPKAFLLRSTSSKALSSTYLTGGKICIKDAACVVQRRSGSQLKVEAKGRKSYMPGGARQGPQGPQPSMPKFDPNDDTPRFVLFIKTTTFSRWYPLSIVTGGTTAKVMVGAMKNEWGRKFYSGTLTRNIGAVIYKDEKVMVESAVKSYPLLRNSPGYQFGYKIMDPKNPKESLSTSNVVKIPPEAEMKTVFDKARDFVGDKFGAIKESFGSVTSDISPDSAGGSSSGSSGSSEKSGSKQ